MFVMDMVDEEENDENVKQTKDRWNVYLLNK